MADRILNTIKKMIGIDKDYDAFDMDLIVHINSIISTIAQIGGCQSGKYITNEKDTWTDIFGDYSNISELKSYMYIKIRLIFDPPGNSFITESMNKIASEFEWRIAMEKEAKN